MRNRMRLKRVGGTSCLIQTNPLASAKMPPDRQEQQRRETIMSGDSTTNVGDKCHNRTSSRCLLAAAWALGFLCLTIASIAHKTEAALQHAAADEPTSLPVHSHQLMLNNQQIFHLQESELGNPNQGAIASDSNQQRPQPLSLRALPVSSRGTLAFVPRGGHARADPTSPTTQLPSHVLSNLDWCSRSQLDHLRSTTEVLAVEGESIKLNFVIIGNHARATNQNSGPGAGAPKQNQQRTGSVHQQQNGAHQQPVRLRLHWQRDNQLIGDLNLARGRFSSTQLAGGDEPAVLRRMLVAHPSGPQQAGGSGASNDPTAQRVYNATRAWHFGARQKIGTKNHNKGEKDYLFADRDDDILYYHLDQNLLFQKLFSIQNKKKVNNNYLNLLDDKTKETNEDQDPEQQYQNQVQDEVQDQATTTKHSFALYPSINARHLETFQRQAATVTGGGTTSSSSLSGASGTSAGDQISLAARQAIGATLKRVTNLDQKQQQQQASGGSGLDSPATTNTNVNKNGFALRQRFGDNFLADGQAIDWPTLGLYLQAHNALRLSANGEAKESNTAEKDEYELEDQQQHHLCQQQQLELEQLIVIQFEISQLRAQDRGQYQLHVCQQSALVGPVANAGQAGGSPNCLQSQLVAVISLQVIEDVPRLESWFEPQLLNPGDRLSIKCEATGYTLPQISWYLDGQLLSEHQAGGGGGGSRLSSTGDVDDSGPGDDDHLLLSSSSSNAGGRSGSSFGYHQRHQAGGRARSVIPSSHQSNQFFRIGDYVSQDNHVHSFVNSSALRLADGGHYKCRANNGHHLVEHEARIDVRGPATIERPLPYNASALQGPNSRWTVQCPYSGYPVASIEWYFRPDSTLKSSHQISPVADQQTAMDYTMETGNARLAREVSRARPAGKLKPQRPIVTTTTGPPEDQQDSLDVQDQQQQPQQQQQSTETGQEYVAGLVSADEPGDAPDPDKDEWLSQASAMTMSPNGEDYPESLPDYPLPVLVANQDSPSNYNADQNRKSHLLPSESKTSASLLDTDEFELSAETEDSGPASRLAPDYGDIEMSYQQLTRRRRSLQAASSSSQAGQEEWVKLPQSRRHQVHPNGSLSIYDIQQADQGHYNCRVLAPGAAMSQQLAESVPQVASNQLYLSVLVPPSISPFSSSESLREGMRNFLTCSVIEGDSPVRLAWLKDGAPIEEHMGRQHSNHSAATRPASRIKVETSSEFTSTLSFSHVDFGDNGNYTCIATNMAASVNYTAKMVVNVPPKWTKNPRDLECVAGQNIVIDCQAEGHPSPRIWWEIGVSSSAAHRSGESKQEELLSSKQVALALTAAGAGSGATQQFGSGELPTMTMMSGQQQQQQHEQPPNHYRTIISNSRIHILENASLVIRDVGRQDQGYYLCQAANNFGSLSALIKLSVNVGASFASKYLMKYVRLNERIELDCDPNGQAPVTVTWFVRQQQQHEQQLGSGTAGLLLAVPPASGNQLNTSSPMFVPTSAMAGNNQSLSNYHHHHQPAAAAAAAGPAADQQQQLASAAASAGASGQRRRLFTSTIQTELPVGQQTAGINLLPHHLAVDGHQQQQQHGLVSSSSFGSASNNNNNNGGQQQHQQQQKLIEIDSTMSFEILKLRNLSPQPAASSNGANDGAEIVRLHIKQARRSHSGEYICQAANQFGGDEKLIRLLVQEPPDPVRDIRATRIESRSVAIAWAVPFTGNSPITSYTVEWARIDGSGGGEPQQQHASDQTGKWSQVVVQQSAASLGPLEPKTDYEIRVRAHNQFGSSPSTAGAHNHQLAPVQAFVVTTKEEAPGAPPSDVRAQALSSSSVQVSWQPPALVGSATMGQTVQESNGKQVVMPPVSRHLSSHSASQLRPGNITGYYVAYRVTGGNSTTADASFIYKTVSVYSLAEDYAPGPTTAQGPADTSHPLQRTADSPRRLRTTLGDLKRNTKYQIIVQAFNSAGAGPPSDPVEMRTLLNDPPPAPLLRLGLVTYTSLELQWSFQQIVESPTTTTTILLDSGASADDHHLLGPLLERLPQQVARFSPLVFAPPPHTGNKNEIGLDANQQLVANGEQPLVDGYHLYFRRAPISQGGDPSPTAPAHEWQERRLAQDTHSIVQNPTGSSDLSIVEHGTKFAGGEPKPHAAAAGWLRFHGPNSTHRPLRYTLDQLTCGTQYQVYLVAYNSYGVGLPSQILRAKTRGSPPLAPRRQQDFLQANSTLVQLTLGAWTDGGCSLANFEVRYKQLRGGRPEAIEMLREGAPAQQTPTQTAHEPVAEANGQSWRLLSNNISPEQRSIELRDLRPATWYGIWVTAESAAGKSEALYAFMTLDQLGQVPSEALDPLPVSSETNLPALFRSGTGGAGGAIRSILYNLSGGGAGGYGGGPNGANATVSPLILSACMVLVVFATCSLFLIRRYNNLVKDNHSIDMSSSRTTTTSAGGGGGGNKSEFDRTTLNHYNNGLDHYSLSDTKPNCHEHHHLHTPLQHYQQPHLSGGGGDTGSIISGSPSNPGDQQQQHHYSMKLSPCKTGGGGGATIITNSSSSTNGSSGAFLLGGGSGGDSSVCDTLAYGSSTPRLLGHHHNHRAGLGAGFIEHQQVPTNDQFAPTNCRLSRLIDAPPQQQAQQFCSQPNCAAHEQQQQQQLGKFATLARGADSHLNQQQHHHHHLAHLSGSPVVGQVGAPLGQQRHSTSFRTLPHSSLRPVSTFLPPNALQPNASGCAMTNGAVDCLNRFYGTDNGGCDNQQHQDLADKQQIYSKLRLLQQYQAATASSAYNLNAICQQQQQQLQEAAESNALALGQIYGANRNNGNALSSEQQQLIEATGHHAQQNLATNNNEQTGQPQQLLGPTQQPAAAAAAAPATAAATGDHQDDYALPFPPKWV